MTSTEKWIRKNKLRQSILLFDLKTWYRGNKLSEEFNSGFAISYSIEARILPESVATWEH